MSFIAALLTFLFFCHPRLLATVAIIAVIVLLFTIDPWIGGFVVAIIVAGVALAFMEQN